MSIKSLADWSAVELAAQTHELSHVETPKVPKITTEQQLTWAVTDLAKCKASILRKNGCISEAMMYLSIGATQRAQEALNKGLLDL